MEVKSPLFEPDGGAEGTPRSDGPSPGADEHADPLSAVVTVE